MGHLVTAVMTFTGPLEDCGPDHGIELLRDIGNRFPGWEVDILAERNWEGLGKQMLTVELGLSKWVA